MTRNKIVIFSGILVLLIVVNAITYINQSCSKIIKEAVDQGDIQVLQDINSGRKYCRPAGKLF
ncbi:hypothetical protein NIES2100_05420 [Calothrix sp. NIES-2100]|nr:hypothetical protein NIES2100_05420 [Calothrix sp. NIES-2100]